MKLLRAFIEASGFDVEDVITSPVEDEISAHDGLSIINSCDNSGMVVVNGEYKRGGNNSYFYRVVDAKHDYKVTKKVTSANEAWQERAFRNWRTPYNET